jgi:hypothetical protein
LRWLVNLWAKRRRLRYAMDMRRSLWSALVGIALGVSFLAGPMLVGVDQQEALAATAYESPYTFDQTWGTAVRLLRVDMGLEITEKDQAHGYLLFKYTTTGGGQKVHTGSMEMVKSPRETVRVTVQINSLPSYHEQFIIDKLAKKLFSEYGDPPKKPDPPPPPPGDGGPDGESSER